MYLDVSVLRRRFVDRGEGSRLEKRNESQAEAPARHQYTSSQGFGRVKPARYESCTRPRKPSQHPV